MDLQGAKVQITSDNENYADYLGKDLIITHASNEGIYYDEGMYPEKLCDLVDLEGNSIPFALYEFEFKVIR